MTLHEHLFQPKAPFQYIDRTLLTLPLVIVCPPRATRDFATFTNCHVLHIEATARYRACTRDAFVRLVLLKLKKGTLACPVWVLNRTVNMLQRRGVIFYITHMCLSGSLTRGAASLLDSLQSRREVGSHRQLGSIHILVTRTLEQSNALLQNRKHTTCERIGDAGGG